MTSIARRFVSFFIVSAVVIGLVAVAGFTFLSVVNADYSHSYSVNFGDGSFAYEKGDGLK